jgi:hypothetical protein
MQNHPFVHGAAMREADQLKAALRDTAATVQEMNAKFGEDGSAPAAPPAEAATAAAPPAKPDSGQAVSKETPPAQPSPPVERTAVTERGAVTALPLPGQRTAPAPFIVPAVPDYSRELQVFVSTVTRNEEAILRAFGQVVEVCNRQQSQIKALERELGHALTSLFNR